MVHSRPMSAVNGTDKVSSAPLLADEMAGSRRLLPRETWQYLLMFLLFVVLGLFLVYPIGLTVRGAFYDNPARGTGFSLRHVSLIFTDPALVRGLINAFLVAMATTTLSLVISLPLAVASAKYRYPFKGVFNALILVPLILPPFVGAIGMQMLLGRHGSLNTLLGTEWDILGQGRFWGVVIVQALHLYPIIYLNATAALANLDPALDEAAENLGCSWWRRFTRITLPLIRPGLFAGSTIVFIWSLTELGTPLVFDYTQITPVQIFSKLVEAETSAEPYALTVVMLVAAVTSYLLGKTVFGRRGHAMYSKASRAGDEAKLPPLIGWMVTGFFAVVTFVALLPHFGVILSAFSPAGQWYRSVLPTSFTIGNFEQALSQPLATSSIRNSLGLASAAVVLDLMIGLLVGYLIVRTRIYGRGALDALCMLPLAVPGLVMAFGYVAMSLRWPFAPGDPLYSLFEWIGLRPISVLGSDPNPFPLLIVAYAIRRLPYIVRATVAGLEQTSGELEEAAMNLGASRFTAVRKVIVPLIMANLIAGALLAFSFAVLEVSDSLLLAQKEAHYPITKAIYTYFHRLGDGPNIASAMGVWGMLLLTVTLVGASVLIGKKLGSIFRV